MRKKYSMDKEWKFHLGDIDVAPALHHQESYSASKAGGARGAAAPGFNDYDWRDINLPHDWAVETPLSKENPLSQGFRKRGIGWYRKTFCLADELKNKQLLLVFGGVSTACEVFFNGSRICRNFSGYTEFSADISDRAYFDGKPNVLAVRVDAESFEGWWYEGAGIYRHVDLYVKNPVHIAHNSVFAKPVYSGNENWNIEIEADIENINYEECTVNLKHEIYMGENKKISGKALASIEKEAQAGANDTAKLAASLELKKPLLWDVNSPNLYTLVSTVYKSGQPIDEVCTVFGCRSINFDADNGFFLNGKALKIKGTCNHQDHAGVGVALPDSLHEYRIQRLKDMGCNAYRCSHGNVASELLNACDCLGMLVLDENRNFEQSPEVLEQVRAMVRRDRNHPSVVMYSLFNEEVLQGTQQGKNIALRMQDAVLKLDNTRPVLGAISGGFGEKDGAAAATQISGINYNIYSFDNFHAANPKQPVLGSENNSAFFTRGCYKTNMEKHEMACYDEESADWGQGIRETWKYVNKRDYIAGIFAWTGFDYRGEPTPFAWPSISTQFGAMDTCGIAKDAFYFYKACWDEKAMLHILPHWNWRKGESVRVMTITNCEESELFLNGVSLGRKKSDIYTQCEWLVNFEAGVLSAKAYNNGKCVVSSAVETAGKPVKLMLAPYKKRMMNNGFDTVPVNVCAVDENGTVVPNACNNIEFSAEGGEIIGVGNGNPNSHEDDVAQQRRLFSGWCQCLLRANKGVRKIVMYAKTDGLQTASFDFEISGKGENSVFIPSVQKTPVEGWRMSPSPFEYLPNKELLLADFNMNSLEPVRFANSLQSFFTEGYMLYHTSFVFPENDNLVLEIQHAVGEEIDIYIGDLHVKHIKWGCGEVVLPLSDELFGLKGMTVLIKGYKGESASGISGGVFLREK